MTWYTWKRWRFALCAGDRSSHTVTIYDRHGRWERVIGRLYWLADPDN